ncbi:MAG: hypothetical protein Fur0037_19480 [Planctomycetota bacterium]
MNMKTWNCLLLSLAAISSSSLCAQGVTLVTPPGRAASEGDASGWDPWRAGSPGDRVQWVLDSTAFTSQGMSGPLPLTGFRWRADGSPSIMPGGRCWNVEIDLSSAVFDHHALSTTFDSNHGADLANVLHYGIVDVADSTGTSPGIWYVDITFSHPFLYGPSLGSDLVVDVRIPANNYQPNGRGPPLPFDAVSGTAALGSFLSNNSATATTGFYSPDVAPVLDWKIADFALARPFGIGCGRRTISVYENFAASAFGLGSQTGTRSLSFQPNGGGGYAIAQGSNSRFSPSSPGLQLTDDSVVHRTLPFSFPFPGGSTASIGICSNGYLWLDATSTAAMTQPAGSTLLRYAPILAPFWDDLDPQWGGSIHFDQDPASGDVACTYLAVAEHQVSRPPNTFQVVLRANGSFELRYRDLRAIYPVLVGFSEGNNASDPGSTDLSLGFTTTLDTGPRAGTVDLSTSSRPVLGASLEPADRRDRRIDAGCHASELHPVRPGAEPQLPAHEGLLPVCGYRVSHALLALREQPYVLVGDADHGFAVRTVVHGAGRHVHVHPGDQLSGRGHFERTCAAARAPLSRGAHPNALFAPLVLCTGRWIDGPRMIRPDREPERSAAVRIQNGTA